MDSASTLQRHGTKRGRWFAYTDWPQVFCDGRPLRLQARTTEILVALVRDGKAEMEALCERFGCTRNTIKVHLWKMRGELPEGFAVVCQHGMCYLVSPD